MTNHEAGEDQLGRVLAAVSQLQATFETEAALRDPMAWRERGAALGIGALDLPTHLGGGGHGASDMARLFARICEVDLDLRDAIGLGHARLLALQERPPAEQTAVLSSVATGRAYCAIAITEEGGGSDLHELKTVAKRATDGFVLHGTKRYVSRLREASHVVVFAKVDDARSQQLTAFLVPLSTAGVDIDDVTALGLRGVSFGAVRFVDTPVSRSQVVGIPNAGISLFERGFSYWRTMMAAAAIGCGRGALRAALHRLATREAFGGPIGRFTHLQQGLSEHVARLHMTWQHVLLTARRLDHGQSAFIHAAMAKAEAVEAALAASMWSMQVHGAAGYSTELDLEKRTRDLTGLRIADGPTDLLRGLVARSLLGDDLYERSLGRVRKPATGHALLVDEFLGDEQRTP